ncbi:MAG: PDZ domain-containing protein [Planctomycetes bacterium]|nr:PDZ domain-containing protein [Planctomycetota bacterium]
MMIRFVKGLVWCSAAFLGFGDDRTASTRRDRESLQPRPAGREPRTGSSKAAVASGTRVAVTREVEPGVWQISADERDRIRDSAKDLLEDAEVTTYVNERTRRAEGMIVDHIEPKSLIAERGLREGDLVQRINGTPVSSKSELIDYVKSNGDRLYDVRVEVLRRGKTIVLEYHAPR